MSKIFIAIDMGGSNTSIFVKGEGIVFKEPSLISVKNNSGKYQTVAYGAQAKNFIGKENEGYLTFSPISEGLVKSDDYCSDYIKKSLSKIFKTPQFAKIECIASIPCAISNEEASKYQTAIQKAGIKKVELIRAPICNALSEEKSNKPAHLMIIDIGGSNTDVAIVNTNQIIKGATLGFGCKAIDNSIKALIEENFALEINTNQAEKIKNNVASLLANDVMSMEIDGFDKIEGLSRNIQIYSNQIFEILNLYFAEILKVAKATIIDVDEEIQQQVLYNGIVLTGGLASITGVCEFIKKEIGIKAQLHSHFENSVILGLSKLLK